MKILNIFRKLDKLIKKIKIPIILSRESKLLIPKTGLKLYINVSVAIISLISDELIITTIKRFADTGKK